jgi:hypothetical protein
VQNAYTTNSRPVVRDNVIRAFKGYIGGKSDCPLVQGAIALLVRFSLNAQERVDAYSTILSGSRFCSTRP